MGESDYPPSWVDSAAVAFLLVVGGAQAVWWYLTGRLRRKH